MKSQSCFQFTQTHMGGFNSLAECSFKKFCVSRLPPKTFCRSPRCGLSITRRRLGWREYLIYNGLDMIFVLLRKEFFRNTIYVFHIENALTRSNRLGNGIYIVRSPIPTQDASQLRGNIELVYYIASKCLVRRIKFL